MARTVLTATRSDRLRPAAPSASGLLGGSLRKLATVLSVRAMLLGAGVVTTVALPLCVSRDEVGLVFLTQSLIAVAATAAQLGLGGAASVLIPAALALDDAGRARAVIGRSLGLAGIAGIAIGVSVWLGLSALNGTAANATLAELAAASPLIAASIPLAALQTLLSELHRGLGAMMRASLLATGASLPVAVALIGAWAAGLRLTYEAVLLVGIVGFVLLAGLSGIGLRNRARGWPQPAKEKLPMTELWARAWPNLISGLVLLLLAQADLWMVALLFDTGTLANYGLAVRMATLVILPLAIVNAVAGPMIAALWARRKPRVLQLLLLRTSAVASIAAVAGYGCVLAIGRPAIERLWGPDYREALPFFAILGLGQLCHAVGGSSGIALLGLGRQHEVMRITAGTGMATIVVALIAAAWLGAAGVALAFSLGLAVQTWLFSRALHGAYGLDATAWHAIASMRTRLARQRS